MGANRNKSDRSSGAIVQGWKCGFFWNYTAQKRFYQPSNHRLTTTKPAIKISGLVQGCPWERIRASQPTGAGLQGWRQPRLGYFFLFLRHNQPTKTKYLIRTSVGNTRQGRSTNTTITTSWATLPAANQPCFVNFFVSHCVTSARVC